MSAPQRPDDGHERPQGSSHGYSADFQWPESFRPSQEYLAPDLRVVEPLGVRLQRFISRTATDLDEARRGYLENIQRSAAWRLCSLAVILFLCALAVRSHLQHRPATLQIICNHQFRAAEIMVWADGKQMIDDVFTGNAQSEMRRDSKPYWVRQASQYSAQPLTLERKPHTIRVRVASTEDPYDHTQETTVDLPPASVNTLQVSCGRGRMAFALYQ